MRRAGLIVLASTLAAVGLLLFAWVVGLNADYAGGLIHLLLVIALLIAPVGTVVGVALLIFASRQSGR